jgi:hypothetical protein
MIRITVSQRIRRFALAVVLSALAIVPAINASSAGAALTPLPTTVRPPSTVVRPMDPGMARVIQQVLDNPSASGTVPAGSTARILSIFGVGSYELSCATPVDVEGAAYWSLTFVSGTSSPYIVAASGTSTTGSTTQAYNRNQVYKSGVGSRVVTTMLSFAGDPVQVLLDWKHTVYTPTETATVQLKVKQVPGGGCEYSVQGHVDHVPYRQIGPN